MPKPRVRIDKHTGVQIIIERDRICAKADDEAPRRDVRTEWEMPPPLVRLPPLHFGRVLVQVRRQQSVARRTWPVVGRAKHTRLFRSNSKMKR
jgi:hypothetical protein